jgi:serine protease
VDVAGGTVVTITGTNLPSNPRVRVGDSATATVITASPTSLTFRAPARVAGVYDVHVFAADGTESVLTAALTYVEGAGTGTPGSGSGAGSGTPGTGSGTDGPGSGTGSGSDGSGGSGTGSGGAGSGSGDAGGSTGPVVMTGPSGERLVRTTKFAALGAIWSLDCSTSCSGVAI